MKTRMKKLATCLLVATGACWPAPRAYAQLTLTITSGVTDPIPIAIVPFARAVPADGGLDVAAVIQRDLESSGRFKAMPRGDMIHTPTTAADVDAAGWKQMRNDYVVVGRVTALADGQVRIDADLVNVLNGQRMLGPELHGAGRQPAQCRASHRRRAVRKDPRREGRVRHAHRLRVGGWQAAEPEIRAVRGRRRRREPQAHRELDAAHHVAGLVGRRRMAGVRVVRAAHLRGVRAGRAHRPQDPVSARAGINGAPAYSPDDKKLALTLSGSNGNLDIYLLDLATSS